MGTRLVEELGTVLVLLCAAETSSSGRLLLLGLLLELDPRGLKSFPFVEFFLFEKSKQIQTKFKSNPNKIKQNKTKSKSNPKQNKERKKKIFFIFFPRFETTIKT